MQSASWQASVHLKCFNELDLHTQIRSFKGQASSSSLTENYHRWMLRVDPKQTISRCHYRGLWVVRKIPPDLGVGARNSQNLERKWVTGRMAKARREQEDPLRLRELKIWDRQVPKEAVPSNSHHDWIFFYFQAPHCLRLLVVHEKKSKAAQLKSALTGVIDSFGLLQTPAILKNRHRKGYFWTQCLLCNKHLFRHSMRSWHFHSIFFLSRCHLHGYLWNWNFN